MAKQFQIPQFYRSTVVTPLKALRKTIDQRRKNLSPSCLKTEHTEIHVARHFGFCYGVEHAIDVAFSTIDRNPGKRIFLISEMIHNHVVNKDLSDRGVQFLMTAEGKELFPLDKLNENDIVVVPAFGATLEVLADLKARGIETHEYNGTCPFVEKVWNRAEELSEKGFSIVVHGKFNHEETKATFSRIRRNSPVIVIKDYREALLLGSIIDGSTPLSVFQQSFRSFCSEGFDPQIHLGKIGVVNQTTMLASETDAIMKLLRGAIEKRYGTDKVHYHFADTRDTLCYATNENQESTLKLSEQEADIGMVVGGYNSSNTSHLVEILEEKVPTYFIKGPEDIISASSITHYDFRTKKTRTSSDWIPKASPLRVLATCGASCPDSLFEKAILRLVEVSGHANPLKALERAFEGYHSEANTNF